MIPLTWPCFKRFVIFDLPTRPPSPTGAPGVGPVRTFMFLKNSKGLGPMPALLYFEFPCCPYAQLGLRGTEFVALGPKSEVNISWAQLLFMYNPT